MNRKKEKHDMLITFYANAKAYKKTQKRPAPFNLIGVKAYFLSAKSRLTLVAKEKLHALRASRYYFMQWRIKN